MREVGRMQQHQGVLLQVRACARACTGQLEGQGPWRGAGRAMLGGAGGNGQAAAPLQHPTAGQQPPPRLDPERAQQVRELFKARWEMLHSPLHSAGYALNPA